MNQSRASRPKGFSLIELGIVLSVIGIALTFAISKINEASDTNKALRVSKDLAQIISNVQRLYSGQGFPIPQMDNGVLIRNNVFPASWLDSTNVLRTPFGSDFRIDYVQQTRGAAIVMGGVPSKVCVELGQLMAAGVEGMWVGNGSFFVKRPDTLKLGSDINLSALGNGCTSSPSVRMAFYFGRN